MRTDAEGKPARSTTHTTNRERNRQSSHLDHLTCPGPMAHDDETAVLGPCRMATNTSRGTALLHGRAGGHPILDVDRETDDVRLAQV